MKFSGNILAFCLVQANLLGASAFMTQTPKTFTAKGIKSTSAISVIGDVNRNYPQDPTQAKFLEERLAALENRQGTATYDRLPNPAGQRPNAYSPATRGRDDIARKTSASTPQAVQGGSLKTWSFQSTAVERVQVVLGTEGRPLNADVDLWHGPDNTPQKMRVYVEDGSLRPFNAVIETPRGPNTIAIRNTGQLEFPMAAVVRADTGSAGPARPKNPEDSKIIQGGALRTYPFEPAVESVQVLLMTDGRPLNARIELLQGPNNNKQVIDLYIEDGRDRPFFAVLETPGSGNVVRVVNTATVEFPMTAWVEPYFIGNPQGGADAVVLGGDGNDSFMGNQRW